MTHQEIAKPSSGLKVQCLVFFWKKITKNSGHYMTPTQTSCIVIFGKSLKIRFVWHLIPPKWVMTQDPWKKIIPARDPKQCKNKNKMQCMCDHSMWTLYVGALYMWALYVGALYMWALYVWPLYVSTLYVSTLCGSTLYVSTLCVTTLCEHSMCEHSICEHSMCEHSMCDHSMWDHSMCPLYGSTLCVTTLCSL